eukprot:CAMPEP_0181176848 /NCGR_PEP_ID=MMETSP1096-20121128/4846_1 /TAXON_ID=156174 ORGANISM="Chrysochromulina ericina, Strain CCMP281" /NCGR_SAMPLE_ID=MMETSP1096 /ASSEMBLY_ACC=CAM_ASM_000453 /LENGTH=103 /DNA_ID=CAMNT_0023264959 /DNA_START=15 /DNA_END=327 /DNA_ORIENTATION=+
MAWCNMWSCVSRPDGLVVAAVKLVSGFGVARLLTGGDHAGRSRARAHACACMCMCKLRLELRDEAPRVVRRAGWAGRGLPLPTEAVPPAGFGTEVATVGERLV